MASMSASARRPLCSCSAAEGVVGLLGGVVDLLLTVLILEGEGEFAARGERLQEHALGFGESCNGRGREFG